MPSPTRLHVSHDYWSNEDELQFIRHLGTWSKVGRNTLQHQKFLLESYIETIEKRVVLGSIQPLTCVKLARHHLHIVEKLIREEGEKK